MKPADSDLTEVMLLTGAPEGVTAAADVFLFYGRGWSPRLTALLGSPLAAEARLVVVSTDPEDPDLQHAERMGLRSASRLAPGDPRLEAWRQWVAHLPTGTVTAPNSSLPAPAKVPELDLARAHHILIGRGLTLREAEIAALAAQGLPNGEIARQLFLCATSVKGTMRRVYRKLGVKRRSGLFALLQ